MRCWAHNDKGQLGDGTTSDSSTPVAVAGISDAVLLEAGEKHTCVIRSSGSVECWGHNNNGQLGDGTTDDSNTPVAVSGLPGTAIDLAAGKEHSCALLDTGEIYCWGRNDKGQLGSAGGDTPTPRRVTTITDGTQLVAGEKSTCVLRSSGDVSCWGQNDKGQLGIAGGDRTMPRTVTGLTGTITALAAGAKHVCALRDDGTVACWGDNGRGQLGDGTTNDSSSPVDVTGLPSAAVDVSAGTEHSCASLDSGEVYCWGRNDKGQLGDGTTNDSTTPVRVSGIP